MNREGYQQRGLYDPAFEHDACGIGAVVDIKGRHSHADGGRCAENRGKAGAPGG